MCLSRTMKKSVIACILAEDTSSFSHSIGHTTIDMQYMHAFKKGHCMHKNIRITQPYFASSATFVEAKIIVKRILVFMSFLT